MGSLDDADLLQAEARLPDAVVNAASSDHRGAVEALISGLSGSGKPFIHLSGSSIVPDLAMGEPSDRIAAELSSGSPAREFGNLPQHQLSVAFEQFRASREVSA